jgi:hypothetical protein
MLIKTTLSSLAVAAALGVAGLAATAVPAAAYVACNRAGECWHVDHRYRYAPEVGIVHHPDDWYFHRDWAHEHGMVWRDHHEGRGYYRNGVWITF